MPATKKKTYFQKKDGVYVDVQMQSYSRSNDSLDVHMEGRELMLVPEL